MIPHGCLNSVDMKGGDDKNCARTRPLMELFLPLQELQVFSRVLAFEQQDSRPKALRSL